MKADATAESEAETPKGVEPVDDLVTTMHTLDLPGGALHYAATVGRTVVREELVEDGVFVGGRAKAQVFSTAYVALGAPGGEPDPARPVVFIFNGGPGSSSVWLHLGLFGPRRVVENDVNSRTPPPYGLIDNLETTLQQADLVFIDPVTTGFTRVVDGGKYDEYHGMSADRDLIALFIRMWLTRNNRWLSPKFLAGESYGTTRAAAVSKQLATRHGVALNGIILISAVLDFATVNFSEGNEAPYLHYLPTFAAIAHYHGKHPGRELQDVVRAAQEFADSDYAWALSRGSRLTVDERSSVAERLAGLIGLSRKFVELADLRVDNFTFFAELLKSRRLRLGRLDSRFTAFPGKLTEGVLDDDPSYPVILHPYTAAINHLLRAELEYETDLEYEILTGRVRPWSYSEFENASVTTAEDLAQSLRINPHMNVYVAFGYFDSATPFAGSEHVLAHLRIPPDARDRVIRRYYEAGHMMYVHQASRVEQLADLAAFLDWSVGSGPRPDSNGPWTEASEVSRA